MLGTPGLNRAVYDLQRKFVSMKTRANTVNAVLQDHAGHIDHRGSTLDGQRKHFATLQEELGKSKQKTSTLTEDLRAALSQLEG